MNREISLVLTSYCLSLMLLNAEDSSAGNSSVYLFNDEESFCVSCYSVRDFSNLSIVKPSE